MVLLLGAFGAKIFYDLEDEKNKLTARDAQVQQLDTELGIAKSELNEVQELNNKYKEEISGFSEKLKEKINEYDLQLKSRDETITALRNKIEGGTTTTIVRGLREPVENNEACPKPEELVIGYAWQDDLGRFHLEDPDIFVEGNEIFVSQQYLQVVGHVFYGKDGQLQVKRIEVREVIPDGEGLDGKPKYRAVPDADITLVASNFEYSNNLPVRKKGLLDIITLRPFVSFDTALTPGLGLELVNLGRLIDYANIGLNTKLALDLSDPLGGSLQRSRIGVGTQYQLLPPFLDTNIALGVGLSMPFDHIGDIRHLTFTIDAIFYLTPDLNPFSSKYH